MPGSVHIVVRTIKSGKRYIVRYRRGGRGYRLEHGGSFKRQDTARERERLIGGWLAAGLDPRAELARLAQEPERQLLIEVGRAWLASRVDLSEQSRRVYSSYLDGIAAAPLGSMDITLLRPDDIRGQIGAWLATGLASKSIRERISVMRQALDFAELEPNPARHKNVRLPAQEERELVLPTAGEVVAIASSLPHRYRLPFVILEQTAMRIGEAVSLERDDVDAGALRFRVKAIHRKGRRGHRRPRWVPVPAWLMEITATSLPLSGPVFDRLTAESLRRAIRDACASAALPHCTPHRLRHRRISLWHFQGIPARELADRAGHSKPSMSLDVYSHVIAPDEVAPDALISLLSSDFPATNRRPRDARVMHEPGA